MSAPHHVLVLPEGAPTRARLLAALGPEHVAAKSFADAEAVLIDCTVPGGLEAWAGLQSQVSGLGAVLVADASAVELWRTNASEVLTPEAIERELAYRVRRARGFGALHREAAVRQRDLQVLLELTVKYAEAQDVEQLLHEMTARLARELDIDRAALIQVDEALREGVIVAASDDAAVNDLHIDLAQYPEVKEAVRTGKPVIVEDAPSHPLFEGVKEKVAARGIQNLAALPLAVKGRVLGVLLLRRSPGRAPFTLREVEFLATAASATAVALRNVQRFESILGQTEREKEARLAAEQRASRLKRFEAYFEHLSDGVAILDDKACVLSLNPAGRKLLDLAAGEAKGRHVNALTNPTDDGVLLEVLTSVAKGEVRTDVDLPARTIAGRKLTLSLSAAPLQGEGAVAILTLRDVTRARQLAEELRQTKEFLERLIDSSVDAIIAADMRGRIILFNKAAEAISNYTQAEALESLDVKKLYPAGVAKDVMLRLRSDDHGGKGRLTSCRQEIVTRQGERVPVNMTAAIVYEGNRETATVGIFSDLREKLQLERKLSDVETRLEESEKNAVLVALAGTAAHELNQPLTSVMGYAELLKRKLKEGDPSFRPVDIIHREAERMAEIVRKIGKITRYETTPYVGGKQIINLDQASHDD
ncbi:MAG: PAS domain S-box protein [Myxococcaceae bacterium]|nr:PAS domain S-box protein [Myxococcaceae bacterium]